MSHGGAPAAGPIVLTGFMGAGKSTVGRLLADRLGWPLVDLDALIEERTGRDPASIIREDGEAAFRRLEAELTGELAARRRMILAPGGGWPTRANVAALGRGAVRVWLQVSAAEVVRRVASSGVDRPLLGPAAGREARAAALLEARAGLYAGADLVVDTEGKQPEAVADEIVRWLGSCREDDER